MPSVRKYEGPIVNAESVGSCCLSTGAAPASSNGTRCEPPVGNDPMATESTPGIDSTCVLSRSKNAICAAGVGYLASGRPINAVTSPSRLKPMSAV